MPARGVDELAALVGCPLVVEDHVQQSTRIGKDLHPEFVGVCARLHDGRHLVMMPVTDLSETPEPRGQGQAPFT